MYGLVALYRRSERGQPRWLQLCCPHYLSLGLSESGIKQLLLSRLFEETLINFDSYKMVKVLR